MGISNLLDILQQKVNDLFKEFDFLHVYIEMKFNYNKSKMDISFIETRMHNYQNKAGLNLTRISLSLAKLKWNIWVFGWHRKVSGHLIKGIINH